MFLLIYLSAIWQDGKAPLHYARESCNLDLIALLLTNGASANAQDSVSSDLRDTVAANI
jgi:ankyrin repeat protein